MAHNHRRQNLSEMAVWVWLVALLALSVLASLLLPKSVAVVFIFLSAATKAFLIAWNYMHLKEDRVLLYALAVPVVLVILLAFILVPDVGPIGHQH